METKLLIAVLLATIVAQECLTQQNKLSVLQVIIAQRELKIQFHALQALSQQMKEIFKKMIAHLALQVLFVIEMITNQLNVLKDITAQWERMKKHLAPLELTTQKKNKLLNLNVFLALLAISAKKKVLQLTKMQNVKLAITAHNVPIKNTHAQQELTEILLGLSQLLSAQNAQRVTTAQKRQLLQFNVRTVLSATTVQWQKRSVPVATIVTMTTTTKKTIVPSTTNVQEVLGSQFLASADKFAVPTQKSKNSAPLELSSRTTRCTTSKICVSTALLALSQRCRI